MRRSRRCENGDARRLSSAPPWMHGSTHRADARFPGDVTRGPLCVSIGNPGASSQQTDPRFARNIIDADVFATMGRKDFDPGTFLGILSEEYPARRKGIPSARSSLDWMRRWLIACAAKAQSDLNHAPGAKPARNHVTLRYSYRQVLLRGERPPHCGRGLHTPPWPAPWDPKTGPAALSYCFS